jgi:hypothetical protein
VKADAAFLDWLTTRSGQLAKIRGPAFYLEIEVGEAEAGLAVEAANRVPIFRTEFLGRSEKAGAFFHRKGSVSFFYTIPCSRIRFTSASP